MPSPQTMKRALVFFAYIVFFALVGFGIYYLITPNATCSDGKKNQGEKDVDCGGPCIPCKIQFKGDDLILEEKTFVPGGNNTYDALIKLSNPNNSFGASSFHYVITLKDDFGKVLATREGDDYILPADSKYVAQLGLETENSQVPAKLDFLITDTKWSQLNSNEKPQLNVYNKKFGPNVDGPGNRAEGLISNESANDFKKVNVVVVLRDENGNVLGVSVAQEENLRAKKEIGFVLTWPYAFSKTVQSMEVDTQTNVFDSQNFSAGL